MSVKGTRLKESESLYFGFAELFLGDSVANEASNIAVLEEAAYFSCLTNVAFKTKKKFTNVYGSVDGITILRDTILSESDFSVSVTFIEMTEKNLSYSLGGDGSTGGNILDTLFDQSATLRAELVFTYPDKVNKMILILPKVKIISSANFSFKAEEPMDVPIELKPMICTHANWSSNPLGKITFANVLMGGEEATMGGEAITMGI